MKYEPSDQEEQGRALKSDGSLWAWGWNEYGQLVLGDAALSDRPARVPPSWTTRRRSAPRPRCRDGL